MSIHLPLRMTSLLLTAATCGCSAPPADQNATGSVPTSTLSDAGPVRVESAMVPTGVVVIDVQSSFVTTASRRNAGAGIDARVANDARIVELAHRKHTPFFITYEGSKTGRSALAPSLVPLLPKTAQEFIKTTFAATGQPQFAAAIRASGLKRLLVIGAETDVCVLQTMLGLRREGLAVVTAQDANFTEEVNVGPALRRMQQAGIASISMNDVADVLDGKPVAGDSPAGAPVVARPLEMGFVLHGTLDDGADHNASAKRARLKELLLLSEWFGRPVLAEDPAAATASLPADLRGILTRSIQPLATKPSTVTQLAIAGGASGAAKLAVKLRGLGAEVFLVEDALVGSETSSFEPAYAAGAVPTTYKSTYYELTRSVDEREWPSPDWVAAGRRYFDLTSAPEDLPPLAP